MMDRHDDVNSKNEQGNISIPPGTPKSWRFKTLLICGSLLVILVILFHYKRKARKDADLSPTSIGPVPVVSAPVKREDVGVYLNAIGTVTPLYADSITSQVTGVVKAVNYREGQFVRKGDPLVDIDPAPYLAQLSQARGALERDENLLSQAQMDFERYKQAWSHNSISRQQYEDQEKVVLQYQGTVNYDKGAVQYAQVQANYCHIVAPISGRVGIRLVDPGNLVTANATTSLVVITQLQPITVIFTLAEDNLSELLDQTKQKPSLPVEVYDRAHDIRLGVGKLTVIDNQIDTTTGTVKLRATFANDDNKLFPNQFVNTRLLVKTLHEQTVVPSSAIQRNGDASFVFVLTSGKAQMRTVKTGPTDHGVTIVQGLQAGDVVATSSFDKLQNGTPIALSSSAGSPTTDRP